VLLVGWRALLKEPKTVIFAQNYTKPPDSEPNSECSVDAVAKFLDNIDNKLSCCCDSRSYSIMMYGVSTDRWLE